MGAPLNLPCPYPTCEKVSPSLASVQPPPTDRLVQDRSGVGEALRVFRWIRSLQQSQARPILRLKGPQKTQCFSSSFGRPCPGHLSWACLLKREDETPS